MRHKGIEFIVSKPIVRFRRHNLNELKESCSFFFSCVAVKSRTGSEKKEDRQSFHSLVCIVSINYTNYRWYSKEWNA